MMDSCVRKSLGGPCKYLDSAWSGIPGRISKIFWSCQFIIWAGSANPGQSRDALICIFESARSFPQNDVYGR
jgi:hypothetical protein